MCISHLKFSATANTHSLRNTLLHTKKKRREKSMGKIRAKSKKMNVGILNIKVVVERLQKSLLSGKKNFSDNDEELEEIKVPEDVKKGHFAVVAEDENELKRFVVPLSFLTHPSFLRLLEQAAEEYGFDHDGALTVPCQPTELERLLAEPWVDNWSTCNGTTVRSH